MNLRITRFLFFKNVLPPGKKILKLFIFLTIFSILGCSTKESKKEANESIVNFKQYSQFVKDTFHISVQVPLEYYKKPDKRYPTVILLDGNFYFPMMSSVLRQYELAELLPPAILVGVGYSSFKTMDSLRVRDYLFPQSIPSDEVTAIGGGQRFKEYLTKELFTKIDSAFRTETDNRCLLGHSFGGYFVLYSLLDQLENKSSDFKTFISASPALWYNNFYLNKIPKQLSTVDKDHHVNIFLSVGSIEDSTWSLKPVRDMTDEINKIKLSETNFQSRTYNHLDHMDVGVISFTKGLQEFLKKNK